MLSAEALAEWPDEPGDPVEPQELWSHGLVAQNVLEYVLDGLRRQGLVVVVELEAELAHCQRAITQGSRVAEMIDAERLDDARVELAALVRLVGRDDPDVAYYQSLICFLDRSRKEE